MTGRDAFAILRRRTRIHGWCLGAWALLVLRVPFDGSIVKRLVDQALHGAAPREADQRRA
jgi:hypothetical protein